MKSIKEIILKILAIISITILVSIVNTQVQAKASENSIEQQLENYSKSIETENITKEDILKIYDEISEKYTNDEIADMLENNSKEIEKQGISEETITAGANFIRTTDPESLRDIIENDIDIEDIKDKINQGYTPNQILKSLVQETPNGKKVEITTKLLLSNQIVKTVLIIVIILFIYGTILRWIIYVKAEKHGWAAIIPLYRQIVMYQICGLSPWLMLLWFIPILGWIAMFIVAIMKRFCLAKSFGRGGLFGFGLLLLPHIFESILAFNPNIKKVSD